jgi:outer membrane protein assembly factor BamB
VGAGGCVYFVGREGTTQVIRNAATFEIMATNKLNDNFDASPAVAGNELYLKGKRYLYCISHP